MIRVRPLLALLPCALLIAAPATAQLFGGADANAPINLDAERTELQSRADRAVFSGNVRVTQGQMKLSADRIVIAYSRAGETEINRVDATGNVVFTRGDETARGKMAIYDLNRRIVTFLGSVDLTQGTNHLRGERLTIDLESGRSVLDGQPTNAGGGRVSATFTVRSADQKK